MEGRQEDVAVEPVHSAAEPGQAVDDVLAVGQFFQPGETISVHMRFLMCLSSGRDFAALSMQVQSPARYLLPSG